MSVDQTNVIDIASISLSSGESRFKGTDGGKRPNQNDTNLNAHSPLRTGVSARRHFLIGCLLGELDSECLDWLRMRSDSH